MAETPTTACPNCGTPATDQTHFCASCGTELPMQVEPQVDGAAPRAWWVIGGVAVALIIAGIAAVLLLRNDGSISTEDVVAAPGATETPLSTTTGVPPGDAQPGAGDTEATQAPTSEDAAASTAPRQSPTTKGSQATTAAPSPTTAPTTAPEAAPTDRSEVAAGLVGEAIENCGGLGFVDTIKGSPTGNDSIYKVEARFVWDDSDPFTASYTVDVDSGSITAADSEAAYLACL